MPRFLPLTAVVAAAIASAQTGPSFEAATVKPRKDVTSVPMHFKVSPNRLDIQNLSLAYLVQQAYDLPAFQLSAPEWTMSHHYDVLATAGAPVTGPEMRAMLRNLLIERFHLTTHWEDRTQAIFRLTVLPGGPKMKAVDSGYPMPNSPLRDGNTLQLNGPMSMRQLAQSMIQFAGKPVLDATNLEGYFKIELNFSPGDADASKEGPLLPLLPKALEEQLGLKLVPVKEAVKILLVDHADMEPVEN